MSTIAQDLARQLAYRGPVRTSCDDEAWARLEAALAFMAATIKSAGAIGDALAIEQAAELMFDCTTPLLGLAESRPVKQLIHDFCRELGGEAEDIWAEFEFDPQNARATKDFSNLIKVACAYHWPAAEDPARDAEAARVESLKAPVFRLSAEEFRHRSQADRIMERALAAPAEDRIAQLIEVREQVHELLSLTSSDDELREVFEEFASFALCLLEPAFPPLHAPLNVPEETLRQHSRRYMTPWRAELWRMWRGGVAPSDPDKLLRPTLELDLVQVAVEINQPHISPIGDIPEAAYLTTDQMNAKRLEAWYGHKLVACSDDFYGYDGRRWVRDKGFAARCAATLAQIVRGEAKGAREQFESLSQENQLAKAVLDTKRRDQSKAVDNLRASPNGATILAALQKAEALEKWAQQCEGATIQQKALGLLRSMHTVEASVFDRDPMLLNCANGTVDLRTGKLKPHDPFDFITKITSAKYDPDAGAPRWERFMSEILEPEVAEFMRRWYGYSATADVSEQCLLVKIGEGKNGKSTEVDVVSEVLGDYADTSAAGLLTAVSDRHPTEVAALFGVRLVTTHESDESAVLREGLLKQLTGGDRINARYLYKDAFTFAPTCKFQLLSNHRPVVKGADDGIWRRLRLVWYRNQFGTPEDVAAGRATHTRDKDLKQKLLAEREGILTWIVRGAIEWNADGLCEPATVLAASETYRREQNRVAKWIEECCRLDKNAWSPYSGVPDGLYPSYTLWCKQSGHQPLSKSNFIDRLQHEVPQFRPHETKAEVNGVRKTVRGCYGLRVDGFRFGPVVGGAQ